MDEPNFKKEEEQSHINADGAPTQAAPVRQGSGIFLPISILVASVLIAGSVFYFVGTMHPSGSGTTTPTGGTVAQQGTTGTATSTPTINSDDVVLGNPNAPVTLIEYGDYQCPYCGQYFTNTEPLIRQNYVDTGKVKEVFRNFAFLGPESDTAAAAALCAQDQNKFWQYHDALYTAKVKDGHENDGQFTTALFMQLASQVGLNTSTFGQCINSGKYAQQVQTETQQASSLYGVDSTPTFFINGTEIVGAMPYDGTVGNGQTPFKPVIDAALAAAAAK